jgi:hypothetical protein
MHKKSPVLNDQFGFAFFKEKQPRTVRNTQMGGFWCIPSGSRLPILSVALHDYFRIKNFIFRLLMREVQPNARARAHA